VRLSLELEKPAERPRFQSREGGAGGTRLLVEHAEVQVDGLLQATEILAGHRVRHRHQNVPAALDECSFVDREQALLAGRPREQEDSGHERSHEVDVARQHAEPTIRRLGHDLDDLRVDQQLRGQQDPKSHRCALRVHCGSPSRRAWSIAPIM